ncbi:MAG: hypothetical protein V3R54_01355 [Thermodesulfovibrionia bacterium]
MFPKELTIDHIVSIIRYWKSTNNKETLPPY